MNSVFCLLPIVSDAGEKCLCRVQTIWDITDFIINIIHETKAYTGVVSTNYVENMSRMLEITPDKYLLECKLCFTTDGGCENFVYVLDNENFKWKRRISIGDNKEIFISYGNILLECIPFQFAVLKMLDEAVNANKNHRTLIRNLEMNVENLATANRETLCEMECFKKEKSDWVNTVYGKFLLLLNSKKAKIAELQNHLTSKENALRTIGSSFADQAEIQEESESEKREGEYTPELDQSVFDAETDSGNECEDSLKNSSKRTEDEVQEDTICGKKYLLNDTKEENLKKNNNEETESDSTLENSFKRKGDEGEMEEVEVNNYGKKYILNGIEETNPENDFVIKPVSPIMNSVITKNSVFDDIFKMDSEIPASNVSHCQCRKITHRKSVFDDLY